MKFHLKVPVGTVGPEGLELPQQLADAVVGPGGGIGLHHDEDTDKMIKIMKNGFGFGKKTKCAILYIPPISVCLEPLRK